MREGLTAPVNYKEAKGENNVSGIAKSVVLPLRRSMF